MSLRELSQKKKSLRRSQLKVDLNATGVNMLTTNTLGANRKVWGFKGVEECINLSYFKSNTDMLT